MRFCASGAEHSNFIFCAKPGNGSGRQFSIGLLILTSTAYLYSAPALADGTPNPHLHKALFVNCHCMTDIERLDKKFSTCCFTLSREDIIELDKNDNGPINNVISRIARHCYGAKLYDDQYGLTADLFYINNDTRLKGDIIRIDIKDPDYYHLLLRFCVLLSNDYSEVDALDSFNIFQTKLRGFLEKTGFFTTTNLELKQFQGRNAVMFSSAQRGILTLDFIDKVEFYRNYFNNKNDYILSGDKEYVYLMVNVDTSLIKIGTSKNPQYREKTLHSQEPDIHLISCWQCDKSIERKLHKMFEHRRIRGEWFRLTLNDLKELEDLMNQQLNNGS
jgi:hypothetical protein